MGLDITDVGVVKQIIQEIELEQNQKRKRKEWDNSRIFNGDVRYYAKKRLQEVYPKTYNSFTVSELNLSKKIVEKLSVSYSKKPKRKLEKDGDTEKYNEIMSMCGGNKPWYLFDQFSNLHRYSCLEFSYGQNIDGSPWTYLRPLTPFQFDRIVDDYSRTICVIKSLPTESGRRDIRGDNYDAIIQDEPEDNNLRRYALYTDEYFVKVIVSGDKKNLKVQYEIDEDNKERKNPLGVIPFVFYQEGDETVLPVHSPIGSQTTTANELMSIIMTGSALQSFGNLIISAPSEQDLPDELQNSLFTYMKLPQIDGEIKTTADYIQPSPDIPSILEVLARYVISVMDEWGIKSSQSIKGSVQQFSSGIDRLLSFADTFEKVTIMQSSFEKLENQLYRIISKWSELTGFHKFTSQSVNVVYNKQKPLLSEEEILKNIKTKFELGLIEPWEALRELEPNITPDEAKKKIEEIRKNKLTSLGVSLAQVQQ